MANPTIRELRESPDYEEVASLSHGEIKEFVIDQLTKNGPVVKIFMIYQVAMLVLGIFFLTRSMVLAFRGFWPPLWFSLAALLFSFSVLIIVHELLHAMALKLTGAPRINFGGYLNKFIFYAEADRHVLNGKQFAFVALTPLVAVKIITLAAIVFLVPQPAFYFPVIVMCVHSLFCAGDIGLLSIFYNEKECEIFTFDVKSEKKSYYFRKVK